MNPCRGILALLIVFAWMSTGWAQESNEVSKPAIAPSPVKPEASAEQAKQGAMKLTLKEGLELRGNPIDFESVKINSLFGEATIPLHTIAGIRFAQAAGEQTTVVLLNGDALTGELALSDVKFVSEWGEAKVNVSHLVSIVFRPDFAWSGVQTPNGKRWRLTKVEEATGPVQQYNVVPNYNQGSRVYQRPR